MSQRHKMPSPEELMADLRICAAARRIWEDIYQFQHKTAWNDLPEKVSLGFIDYRHYCLFHAWSALRED